jgi:hypothetical protein
MHEGHINHRSDADKADKNDELTGKLSEDKDEYEGVKGSSSCHERL